MKKRMLKGAVCALAVVAGTGAFAGELMEEELFGERIYFRLGDKFETGNLLDYFHASWAASLFRNLHGYEGYCVRSLYGVTRPIKVEAGKTYRITFKAYNEGMEGGYHSPTNKTAFPEIRFIDGTHRLRSSKDSWKTVKPPAGWKLEGQLTDCPPPAEWKEYALTFTVPEGATMATLSFCKPYRKKSSWGPYCLAEFDMKEVK